MCTNLGPIGHTCIVKELCFFVASATFQVHRRELTRSSGLHRWTRRLFLTSTFSSDRVTLQTLQPSASVEHVRSDDEPRSFCASGVESSAALSRRTTGKWVSSWTCWSRSRGPQNHFAYRDLIFWNRCPASLPHGSVCLFKMTAKSCPKRTPGISFARDLQDLEHRRRREDTLQLLASRDARGVPNSCSDTSLAEIRSHGTSPRNTWPAAELISQTR